MLSCQAKLRGGGWGGFSLGVGAPGGLGLGGRGSWRPRARSVGSPVRRPQPFSPPPHFVPPVDDLFLVQSPVFLGGWVHAPLSLECTGVLPALRAPQNNAPCTVRLAHGGRSV